MEKPEGFRSSFLGPIQRLKIDPWLQVLSSQPYGLVGGNRIELAPEGGKLTGGAALPTVYLSGSPRQTRLL